MAQDYLSTAIIPFLMALVLAYYSVRLLVYHDVAAIRGKNGKKLKNEAMYTKEAGRLIAFMAAASLVMALLLAWNSYAALAEIGISFVVFGVLWKKMNDKYGE